MLIGDQVCEILKLCGMTIGCMEMSLFVSFETCPTPADIQTPGS